MRASPTARRSLCPGAFQIPVHHTQQDKQEYDLQFIIL